MRPGRRIAGSIKSGRFDARMITTSCRDSMPSISAQNIGTRVLLILNDRIDRLVPNTDSASSIKMNGNAPSLRLARAFANRSRTIRSDSPSHIFKISGPLMCRNAPLVTGGFFALPSEADCPCDSRTNCERLAAAAWPISVLPHPGGP